MADLNKDELEVNSNEESHKKNEKKPSQKDEVEKKIQKQMEKKREKEEGHSRILEYLKEEHQWENYLFVALSIVTLLLGCLILNGSLVVKDSFPILGDHPTGFAWVLIILSAIGLVYSVYPFFKPAFPEFKKITWLTWPKFIANTIRVFVFIIVFTLLFMLYDSFITEILSRIFN